jgi:urocanate hydratase
LAQDLEHSAAQAFILETYRYYVRLMQDAPSEPGSDASQSLGGRLFWAGELDGTGRALVVAGNVAGAATLAATSDTDVQRQAVRDGIIDFLVNSLDEALRILKNEIRKRETVAVCVAAPMEAVAREMTERGVRPDVFREGAVRADGQARALEQQGDSEADPMNVRALVMWRVDRAPALWQPKLDAIALGCLGPDDAIAQRWLMRSSRYLGRLGQAVHLIWADRDLATRMIERVRECVKQGDIKVRGRIECICSGTGTDLLLFGSQEESGAPPQS